MPARLALRRPARRPRLAPLVPADHRVVAVEEVPVALVLAFPLVLIGVQLALPVGLVDHPSLSHLIVSAHGHIVANEIGSASWRERVCLHVYISVVAVSLKNIHSVYHTK